MSLGGLDEFLLLLGQNGVFPFKIKGLACPKVVFVFGTAWDERITELVSH